MWQKPANNGGADAAVIEDGINEIDVLLIPISDLQVSANYNVALGTTGETNVVNSTLSTAGNILTGKTKANAWQLSVAYFF